MRIIPGEPTVDLMLLKRSNFCHFDPTLFPALFSFVQGFVPLGQCTLKYLIADSGGERGEAGAPQTLEDPQDPRAALRAGRPRRCGAFVVVAPAWWELVWL